MPAGAFDAETSDSYLNRLIVAGTDPEQAVDEYVNLDLGKTVNLDRLYELMIDRQRARDAATGYNIAAIIERHFKTEYIFLSPYRPNTRVALALAEDLFRRMGATSDDIDRMRARTRVTPFPVGETPIHPGVCRHWGLDYIAPDQRYRFRHEGSFTFREYALRYMRYEWNPALEEGMWLSHQRRYAEAIAPLRTALTISPRSASGWNALGEALCRSGHNDAALVELRKAIDIDPADASYHASLGNALREAGRLAEAEAALRQAMAADPTEPHYPILLAHLTRQQNKFAEAAKAFEAALALDPWAVPTWQELAGVREALADWAGAQQALQRAIEIDEADTGLDEQRPDLPGRHDRHDDAVDTARRPVEQQPERVDAGAVPTGAPQLQGLPQPPLQEAFKAAVVAPDNAEAYHSLGCLLREAGDFVAAEQAFRRALGLRPAHAHYHHELSVLYLQSGRQAGGHPGGRRGGRAGAHEPAAPYPSRGCAGQRRGIRSGAGGAARGSHAGTEPSAVPDHDQRSLRPRRPAGRSPDRRAGHHPGRLRRCAGPAPPRPCRGADAASGSLEAPRRRPYARPLPVEVGEGRPSTERGACGGNAVDGRPSPTTT